MVVVEMGAKAGRAGSSRRGQGGNLVESCVLVYSRELPGRAVPIVYDVVRWLFSAVATLKELGRSRPATDKIK
jgi:hypothetical protein